MGNCCCVRKGYKRMDSCDPSCKCMFALLGFPVGVLVILRTTINLVVLVLNEVQPCEIGHDLEHAMPLDIKFTRTNHKTYFTFSQLLYFLLSFLQWFEYGYLFYGILCYYHSKTKISEKFQETGKFYKIGTMIFNSSETERDKESNPCGNAKKKLKRWVNPIAIGCFFVLYLIISIASPAVSMAHVHVSPEGLNNKTCNFSYVAVDQIYHTTTIAANLITVGVRLTTVIAAAICGNIWLKLTNDDIKETQDPPAKKLSENLQASACTNQQMIARNEVEKRFYNTMKDYEARKEIVKPIYKIFRSWFMFQWVYYLFKLSHDLVYVIAPWIWAEDLPDSYYQLLLARDILICLFDILTILTSYLAALKMNAYMRRYIRDKQKKLVKEAENNETQYAYAQTDFKITMIPRSDFSPKVPGFGMTISLRGPGFVIATVILIIGTVATFSKV